MGFLYLAIAIVAEVAATSLMRATEGFTRPLPTAIMLFGYAIAFYFMSLSARTVPIGVAYAIWSGVGIILIAAIAWFFQGQKLDAAALFGMALIVAGVLWINIFSKSAAQH